MPQITNLRLLLTSPLKPSAFQKIAPRFPLLFAAFSSFSQKQRDYSRPLSITRRKNTTLRETTKKIEKDVPMEEAAESATFNKRRAEGRDKSSRPPKVLHLKDRKLNPVNTLCYVQIMGTGMDTQDTSPSVLLFFDKQRFIFNAGEGLQRFCTEHKIKLSKIDHIFLSRVCSETAGGLPGLLLTLAGMGDEGMSVKIWGPSDLKYLVDAMKSFIPKAAVVHTYSFGPSTGSNGASLQEQREVIDPIALINDEVVKLSAILLRPSTSEASQSLSAKPGDISVVYVCELPEIKGKFDPKKAVALGLKRGPKYRELQLGISVKSDLQDIMVHPSDVMDASIPGPIVLIVDCPTLGHFQELVVSGSLEIYYGDMSSNLEEPSKAVNCIIHLSPASVINTSAYKEWMARFGAAQHIMAGHEMKNIDVPILKASARITARLNYLCPQFFPAPGFWSVPGSKTSTEVSEPNLCKSIPAENLLKFHLRPYSQLGLDRVFVPSLTSSSEVIDELLSEIPEVADAAKQVSQFWKDNKWSTDLQNGTAIVEEPWLPENNLPCCLEDISREDMEIVLLGTGSSQPSKYRNVSSIFINLFSKGGILLDCGEGTLGQLKRRFGVEGADEAVRGLRCVWISHIHADHHTGLVRILALRRDLLKGVPHEPLLVVGPSQLRRFLNAYQFLEDLDMQFLDCMHTTEASLEAFESNNNHSPSPPGSPTSSDNSTSTNGDANSSLFAEGTPMQSVWKRPDSVVNNSTVATLIKKLKKVLREAGLDALVSFPVVHCPQAFGVILKASDRENSVGKTVPGWKIVYSGDSRPCPETVKASRGATVLIHEATFEDGMVDEAIARNHSTTQEAIEVGNTAEVYRIILTHFSQRYPKIPVFDESHMRNTCIAFDLMSVNLADLPVLPKVLPYLKTLFRDEMGVDENETTVDDEDVAISVAN